METVAAFTDTYLPTVNGVTYTVTAWRDRWCRRGGRMAVVYPGSDHEPADGEVPVRSVPFPFYDGYRLGLPTVPRTVRDADVVHVHTPFSVGVGGLRLARKRDLPVVASYHTPTGEYADYLAPGARTAGLLRRASECWERNFLDRADAVIAPSAGVREHLVEDVGVTSEVHTLSNGVDVGFFRPVHPGAFRARHDLPDGPLVGYTGRHGYEKRLEELIEAAAALDATVVLGGDGPARPTLERLAAERGVDARFLGFLDRNELPEFYSALDVFAFPSPVETEGLVALEAMACGTPVVGAKRGALAETVDDGEVGYHFDPGDVDDFRRSIRRALENRPALREESLNRRDAISVDNTIDRLESIYASL